MERVDVLARSLQDFATSDGIFTTDLPGLYIARFSTTEAPRYTIDRAVLCVVTNGSMTMLLQREQYACDRKNYVVVSLDLPLVARIKAPNREGSFFALTLELDFDEIASLVLTDEAPPVPSRRSGRGIFASSLSEDLTEALISFIRLLKKPEQIPILGPLIRRHILYLLLCEDHSGVIRNMGTRNSQVQRIAHVVELIKRNFAKSIRMQDLARRSQMSSASLHSWFKAVTTMTPLQYQKRLRLQEGRRLLYSRGSQVTTVSQDVGYESVAHFTRDYSRFFGLPPKRDVLQQQAHAKAQEGTQSGLTESVAPVRKLVVKRPPPKHAEAKQRKPDCLK